jgi:hypothetical protein
MTFFEKRKNGKTGKRDFSKHGKEERRKVSSFIAHTQ